MISDFVINEFIISRKKSETQLEDFNKFACRCLLGIEERFPTFPKRVLNSAADFWIKKRGTVESLQALEQECWSYFNQEGKSVTRITEDEDIAVRLVICCLQTRMSGDSISDYYDFFFMLLKKFMPFTTLEVASFREAMALSN